MSKHLDLEIRMTIQEGLKEKLTYAQIAERCGINKSTVSREVQKHRTFISYKKTTTLQSRNVCTMRYDCNIKQKCKSPTCFNQHHKSCKICGNCNSYCKEFQEEICDQYDRLPYVCNGCVKKPRCPLSKWVYDAKQAQKTYEQQLSEARTGIALNEIELSQLDQLISPLLQKGQSVRHICHTNNDIIPVSDRTLYKYLHANYLSANLFHLQRTVQRKDRKKSGPPLLVDKACRVNRTYADFTAYLQQNPDRPVVEMDTVEGNKGGKVILTIFFRNCHLQLGFLRDRNTSASVSAVFDHLRQILTPDEFSMLFSTILTDRGSEFSDPVRMETDMQTGEIQSRVFYCDPQNSNQKSGCERNHEFLRYILPKGTSMNPLNQEKVDLMFCHINSYSRPSLSNKSPAELFLMLYGDSLGKKLGVKPIDPPKINLTPTLIK